MRTLSDIYREVETVADFTGIQVNDPNALGLFQSRPLHVAAVWGDCEAIELLVQAGAVIDQQGEHGFTPLMEAVAQGNYEAAQLLVKLGAKPVRNEDGQLPSEYAAISQEPTLAIYLKENGL